MPEFPKLPIIQPPQDQKKFPELPIITPDPPRLTLQEKYGSFYYLGIAGLVITLALVAQFIQGLWSTRDIWYAVYALNDMTKPEPERIEAAWVVARSAAANDPIRYDLALRTDLPELARYILAEGLTSDAIRADTKAYALMVAKSQGWPDWLRLTMARPLAYGAGDGYRIAWEPLELIRANPDQALGLLATYTKAIMIPGDAPSLKALADAAATAGPYQPFAQILHDASKLEGDARTKKLDEATRWLRTHHPGAKLVWKGWEEREGQLVQVPVTKAP